MSDRELSVRLCQAAPIALHMDLSCAPGELLALVGPSGSGKSTILRAIAGLSRTREGRIACGGETWFDAKAGVNLTPRQRRIGMVFQQYALFPHLSALENVTEALQDLPRLQRGAVASDWLRRLHLQGMEDRRPSQLSGGQQQRVAVARALARQPRALLLDEPFSAVDHVTREALYQELAELRRGLAIPIILVTHDLDEALTLADRMSILWQGATLQTGTPSDLVSRPDTVRVAHVLGHKNIFRAGVIEHRPEAGVTVIEWRRHRLHARLQPQFAPGTQVAWTIPKSDLVLRSGPHADMDARRNDVTGEVSALVRLGENAALTVDIDGSARPPLFMSIPLHAAKRDRIAPGVGIVVSFLPEGIHLMPPDKPRQHDEASHGTFQFQAGNIA